MVSGMHLTVLPTLAEPMLVSPKFPVGGAVAATYSFTVFEEIPFV